MIIQALFYLREYFFPSGCGCCAAVLYHCKDSYYGLCTPCRDFLSAALVDEGSSRSRCGICGRHLISEIQTCLSCRTNNNDNGGKRSSFVKMHSLFPYSGKFRSVLGAYKFGKSIGVANFLVQRLSLALGNFEDIILKESAWVPVPPRSGKIKKQGWDQIEHLAHLLENRSKRLDKPLAVRRCLKRLPSRSQKGLNREQRSNNLKGRIVCTKPPPKTAILFDDVITTGTTFSACAQALLEGGSEKVYGISLFYD